MRKLIAGNWKMNGLQGALGEIEALIARLEKAEMTDCDILLCPPFTLLSAMVDQLKAQPVAVGGQDCHWQEKGAHTGDISAAMLADCGATYVIVGHSERRADHGESDEVVRQKAEAALLAGLTPIICVGESLDQRDAGEADRVVMSQLKGSVPKGQEKSCVIAYEPVWAIGTGKVASAGDIEAMHGAIRNEIGDGVRLLYGGSVKPSNAGEILHIDNVDGALVGGASLLADDFYGIISSC